MKHVSRLSSLVRLTSLSLAVAALALTASAGTLDLAVRGRAPEYVIVRAADASPSVKYAAEELRDFTERLTGVRLPIVEVSAATRAALPPKAVFLNMSRLSSQVSRPLNLGNDGFSLKVVEGDLLVTGGNRGVLYGVYELLERFGGCRWYASWHTVVPARNAFSVPDDLDDAQMPAFPHREPFWWDMFNGDFAARNRANGPAMRVGAKHGGPAGRFGGGLGSCHTFNRLLPPEKYFDAHPEYFSMVKGKRLKERTQLCLTNPDVLRIVTSNVLACIRKDPTADYYGVSQNDWYNYCECPACAAVDAEEESHAGTMVRFVNAIAEEVEKEFPDKIIETLAYQYTRKPPKKTKLRHNVMPCLCTIECDFSRPLPDSRYHQNVKFVDEIKAWRAQATRLYVWDYVTDFHCYPYPFPDTYALQGNVQFFRDNGVYALFEQGDRQGCNAGFAELKAWLLAKWMWNPERPMKPLLDDFFTGFYGAGAPFVREYFEELHRLQIAYTSADTNRWLNCHQDIPGPDIPAEFWDSADALLEKAVAAVKGDKTLEFNVRTARFGVDYVRLEHFRKKRGAVVDLTGSQSSHWDNGHLARCTSPQIEIPKLARRALAFVDEVKHMRLCSSLTRQEKILDAWRRIADGTLVSRTDGVAEDEFLHLLRLGDGNERVSDPRAEDGHAAKLANPQPRWSVHFPMHDAAFASGTRYSVQMRLRADLTPGRKGPAVTAGIYDPKTKKYACTCAYPAEKLSGDYAWYVIGTFDPSTLSESAYLYVGDGYLDKKGQRFVPALYLDKIRFQVCVPDPLDQPRAEFGKYYRQIVGKEMPEGLVAFAIDPKVSKSGRDAYRILTTASGQRQDGRAGSPLPAVTITGSNLRSVYYGIYDLLERRGGCRWFWDGDVVPKKGALDLSGLDVKEEAHFEYRGLRYFAHRGLTRFQAEHWGLDDWKKEIDWMLKRRLNVFMLRIGQDDLFQRTFPETCAYPDPARPLPGTGKAHDDRTLFWSLQYRGELRRNLQKYAFDRGLMVPEDFGTMTHWYSRTPEDFLAKKKPDFIPLANKGANYQVPNAQVWNIRDDKWVEEYWKMTKTAVETYGQGAPEPRLLHTIGLGERMCYKDRKRNFDMKILALGKFLAKAHTDYPDAKVLLAGWDFYDTWKPEEVKALLPRLDPTRDIIWDYEGDLAPHERKRDNWFGNWGVVGKFPYTYSMFLAYENALDIRANYPVIEERQKIVQNDLFCKGFILWPESSHTDTLALRYFTANAWSATPMPHGEVLDELCASRYGENAALMKAAWKAAIPASYLRAWGGNYGKFLAGQGFDAKPAPQMIQMWAGPVKEAEAVFGLLARVPWKDDFIKRDSIDIARTVLDRVIALRTMELCRDIVAWRTGTTGVSPVGDGGTGTTGVSPVGVMKGQDARSPSNLVARANTIAALCEKMADLLALHTDYSMWESYQRLDAVEKIQNPDFSKTLFENASCPYCRSHQYELARHWYAVRARQMAERLAKAVASGDRKAKFGGAAGEAEQERLALKAKPLESLKPDLPRTEENFRKALLEVQELLD